MGTRFERRARPHCLSCNDAVLDPVEVDRIHGGRVARRYEWRASDGHNQSMSTDSFSEAKDPLSELIGRALKGEGVVITRQGRPLVELKPIDEPARAASAPDLDWLEHFHFSRTHILS